jgi:hypothetical protein
MLLTMVVAACLSVACFVPAQAEQRVNVRVVTDEVDAVLAILAKREAKQSITDADWQRLFGSEGYRRLKAREAAMQRAFTDDDFKAFVLSPDLLTRAAKLRQTLDEWKGNDVNRPASRALAYLPPEATIRATVYPEIKPKGNSFVFDVPSDPAIFLYVNPEVSRQEFENTQAHELHHIGYGTACPPKAQQLETEKQPANIQELKLWIGAFGEGFAVLAAAGGPDIHPHVASSLQQRERWDRDVADFAKNQKELDAFFLKILNGELTNEEANKQAFTYYGEQGPWYTVGWKMAVTIEKAFGRQRFITAMCDRSTLLATYNEAATKQAQAGGEKLPLWSKELVSALQSPAK